VGSEKNQGRGLLKRNEARVPNHLKKELQKGFKAGVSRGCQGKRGRAILRNEKEFTKKGRNRETVEAKASAVKREKKKKL